MYVPAKRFGMQVRLVLAIATPFFISQAVDRVITYLFAMLSFQYDDALTDLFQNKLLLNQDAISNFACLPIFNESSIGLYFVTAYASFVD